MTTPNTSITSLGSLSFCKKIIDSVIGPNLNIDDSLSVDQEDQIEELNQTKIYLTFGHQTPWDGYTSDQYTVTSAVAQLVAGNTTVLLSANANSEIDVGDTLAFSNKGIPSVYVPGANVINIASGGLSLELNTAPTFTVANATIIRTRYYSENTIPPSPTSIYKGEKIVWDNMLGGVSITGNDMCVVSKRYTWTANTVYAKYNPNDATLFDKPFYVINSQYSVYKCLDNMNDSPSTEEPSFIPTNDWRTPVITSDGYVWKYMFTLSTIDIQKFLTDNYMPVRYLTGESNQPLDQWYVQAAAIPGAIENVIVVNSGSGYIIPSDGQLAVQLLGGGGVGATASIDSVDMGTISSISVSNPGFGYGENVTRIFTTTASSNVVTHNGDSIANTYVNSTIYGDIIPLDAYVTSIDNASDPKKIYISANASSNTTNTAVILGIPRVSIIGGAGTNAAAEAIVSSNVVSSIIVTNVGQDYVTPISFNIEGDGHGASLSIDSDQIGLNGEILAVNVDSPGNNYSNVVINITGGSGSGAILEAYPSPYLGHGSNPEKELDAQSLMFSINLMGTNYDLILAENSEYRQVALIENPLASNSNSVISVSAFFQPTQVFVNPGINNYDNDEIVYQGDSLDNATFSGVVQSFDSSNNVLYLTNTFYKNGTTEPSLTDSIIGNTSGAHREYSSQIVSPVIKYSGAVLFIQNFTPIQRAYTQSELIRIVMNQ